MDFSYEQLWWLPQTKESIKACNLAKDFFFFCNFGGNRIIISPAIILLSARLFAACLLANTLTILSKWPQSLSVCSGTGSVVLSLLRFSRCGVSREG